jgi:parallel beta-helix repeat protein
MLVIGIIILFIGLSGSSSLGTTIIKKSTLLQSNGNTLFVGGSGEGNYTKIQIAIDDANDGDTIFVFDDSSPYHENIILDKPITLIGEQKNTTIIDGNGFENTVSITDNYINIGNFTIRNSNNYYKYAGIRVIRSQQGGNENIISNNIVIGNGMGIYITGQRNIVCNNMVTSNKVEGIFINSGDGNIVYGNTVNNNEMRGIVIAWASDTNITGNTIINNDNGIRIETSENTTVNLNTIVDNRQHGIDQTRSNNSTFCENHIVDNKNGYGVWLKHSCNNNIFRNYIAQTNFSNEERALLISVLICYNSDNNNFSLNTVSNDYFGMCIGIESYNNTCYMNNITNCLTGINTWTAPMETRFVFSRNKKPNCIIKNNFIDNQIHGLSKYWIFSFFRNRWDGNYWGRSRIFPKIILGLRMIGNFFGIPFRFDVDWHPAQEPFDIAY